MADWTLQFCGETSEKVTNMKKLSANSEITVLKRREEDIEGEKVEEMELEKKTKRGERKRRRSRGGKERVV